jgi:hypothetical protein
MFHVKHFLFLSSKLASVVLYFKKQSLPGCLPELTLVSARELGQAEPEGRGNLISKDCGACPEPFRGDCWAYYPVCTSSSIK